MNDITPIATSAPHIPNGIFSARLWASMIAARATRSLLAQVPIVGPGELGVADGLGGIRHPLEAEITRIGQDRGQNGVRIVMRAAAWFLGGFVQIMRGEPDNAIERLAYAMRSSPFDSEMYRMQCETALAHFVAGRFDEAAPWADKALRDLPSFLIAVCIIAASHAFAGR